MVAVTVDQLIADLKSQLETNEIRELLLTVGFSRRVDITLFVDRGVVVKRPRIHID